jgi:hypothetical protein
MESNDMNNTKRIVEMICNEHHARRLRKDLFLVVLACIALLSVPLIASGFTVEISSTPDGADVVVNDKYQGKTPIKMSYISDPIRYTIEVKKQGYEPVVVKKIINASLKLHYELQLLPSEDPSHNTSSQKQLHSLTFVTTPANTAVFLNDEYKGVTPLSVFDLPKEWYTIQFQKTGYQSHEQRLYLSNDVLIEFTLQTLTRLQSEPISDATSLQIEQLLQQADVYFNKKWFIMPEESNAFALYKKVLTSDPTNGYAKKKLSQIIVVGNFQTGV